MKENSYRGSFACEIIWDESGTFSFCQPCVHTSSFTVTGPTLHAIWPKPGCYWATLQSCLPPSEEAVRLHRPREGFSCLLELGILNEATSQISTKDSEASIIYEGATGELAPLSCCCLGLQHGSPWWVQVEKVKDHCECPHGFPCVYPPLKHPRRG